MATEEERRKKQQGLVPCAMCLGRSGSITQIGSGKRIRCPACSGTGWIPARFAAEQGARRAASAQHSGTRHPERVRRTGLPPPMEVEERRTASPQPRRKDRQGERRPALRPPWVPRRRALRTVFWSVGGLVVLGYVGLTTLHFFNGFSLTSALSAGLLDVQVTKMCWGEWTAIKDFVDRPALFGKDAGGIAIELSGGQG